MCLPAAGLDQSDSSAGNPQEKQSREKTHRDGKRAIRSGKYEEAIKLFDLLIESDSRDIPARLGAALAYSKLGNHQRCYDQANEVLKLEANNARAHGLVGLALLRSGFIREAVWELNEAFRLDPKEPLAWGAAAEIDYYEGRSKEARDKSLRAFGLDSQEPDFLITYARASSRLEEFRDAADAYQRFLEISPEADRERRERIRGLVQFYRRLAGLEVHQISGPESVDVPFRLGTDRRPYLTMRINGRDANFVVDTGSGFTVISSDAAKRFGVPVIAKGGTSQGVGGDGKFPIVYGLIRSLQIGDVKIKAIPCFVRPFHGVKERPPDERADGFLGLSVLSHFLTQLDYKHSRIRLDRNEGKDLTAAFEPGVTVVPFRTTQNGLISVETELDGSHRINAILDSGASSSVISTAAVDRLKMHDSIIKGQTVRVVGAAGISENVELLFIRNCKVADLQQNNLRALVLPFNAINETSGFEQSGILGGDFLRHFRVAIDFTRAQVGLQPYTAAVIKQ
jgi:predicted aspartyl protease